MRRKQKKSSPTLRLAKFVGGSLLNLTEDVIVEAINTVPGYPKVESYGQYLRKRQAQKKRRK